MFPRKPQPQLTVPPHSEPQPCHAPLLPPEGLRLPSAESTEIEGLDPGAASTEWGLGFGFFGVLVAHRIFGGWGYQHVLPHPS